MNTNTRRFLAISTFALLGTLGAVAHADGEGDSQSPYALKYESTRSVDDVTAEAIEAAQHHSLVSAASLVHAPVTSATDRAAIRATAIQAARADRIARGEYAPS